MNMEAAYCGLPRDKAEHWTADTLDRMYASLMGEGDRDLMENFSLSCKPCLGGFLKDLAINHLELHPQ